MHTHRPTALKPGWLEKIGPPEQWHPNPDLTSVIVSNHYERIGWKTFWGFLWQMWCANRAAHKWPYAFDIKIRFPIPWW
tara:strand:- start:23198 stop:23434 length:237 start_codon:yes stop_codon:yes gene_type:complete